MSQRAVWVATTLACLTLLSYLLGTDSFSLPKWVWLMAAAAIALIAGTVKFCRNILPEPDSIDLIVVVLCLWAWASLIWAPDILSGLIKANVLTALIVLFLFFRHTQIQLVQSVILATSVIAVSIVLLRLLLFPAAFGGFGNENYVTEFLLLTLPYLVAWFVIRNTRDRWLGAALVAIAVFYMMGFNPSRLEFVVLPAMITAWMILACISREKIGMAILIASFTGAAACVLLTYTWDGAAVQEALFHRVEIFINTTTLWMERPILGHGLGGFIHEYPRLQQDHINGAQTGVTLALPSIFSILRTAHNEYLQLVTELGTIGGLLGAAAIVAIGRNTLRYPISLLHAAALVSCIGAALIAAILFPFQNPATAAVVVASLAILSRSRQNQVENNSHSAPVRKTSWYARIAVMSLCAAFVAAWTIGGAMAYISGRHAYTAEVAARENDHAARYVALLKAYETFPASPNHRRVLFTALVGWAEKTRQPPFPEATFDELYSVSSSASPYAAAILLARVRYLGMLPVDRLRNTELEKILANLKKTVPFFAEIFVLEAEHALRFRQYDRARAALEQASALAHPDSALQESIARLQSHLNKFDG